MYKHKLTIHNTLGGKDLYAMFSLAIQLLKTNMNVINAINVFPVADGDTGTNVLMTIQAATAEGQKKRLSNSASQVASAMAQGALVGAKGNSGVILSQFFKGLAVALEGKEEVTASDFAFALEKASELAYAAIENPVEGTILTIIRQVALTANMANKRSCSLPELCEKICEAAKAALASTTDLLPALKNAGVVDAGGQALYIILEGIRLYIRGERQSFKLSSALVKPVIPGNTINTNQNNEKDFGYCTNFMVVDTNIDSLKKQLGNNTQSVVIVGDNQRAKVHVHTLEPITVLARVASSNKLVQVQIDNMDKQHSAQQEGRLMAESVLVVILPDLFFADLFIKLGVSIVVLPEMNNEILVNFINQLACKNIIILVINKKAILNSKLKNKLANKQVYIIQLQNAPQAITAALSFNEENHIAANLDRMQLACLEAKTGEIIKCSTEYLGYLGSKKAVSGKSIISVLTKLLSKINFQKNQLLTLYLGNDLSKQEESKIKKLIDKILPGVELEVIRSNHPDSCLIFSLE